MTIPSRVPGSPVPGVLLFNLGGPETLDDVRPFLFNLFSDPEIIRIKNNSLRKLLAWFIATTRQGKSRRLYRDIGGGSPLRKITEAQAEALQERLEALGHPALTYIGMRCWRSVRSPSCHRRPGVGDGMEPNRPVACLLVKCH